MQLAEQHGNGGEGGEEMEIEIPQFRMNVLDMTKEQLNQYVHVMQQEYASVFDSAPAPAALLIRASPACHCAPAL